MDVKSVLLLLQVAVEAITNIRTVASLHREEHITTQYKEALRGSYQASVKKAHMKGIVGI